jgi:predicted DNA-binding transcriptional regulator AlpA
VTVAESVPSLTVNVPTAAHMLGISRGYAFELAKRGELPGAVRVGGRIVVSRRVLEETINGKPDPGE